MNWGMILTGWVIGSLIFLPFQMRLLERKFPVFSMTFFYLIGVGAVCGLKMWFIANEGVNSYPQYAVIPLLIYFIFTVLCYQDTFSKKALVIFLFYVVSAIGEIITGRVFIYLYKTSAQEYFRPDIFWNVMIFNHGVIALFLLLVEMIWKKQRIEKGTSRDWCFLMMLFGQILFFLPNVTKPIDVGSRLSVVSLIGVMGGAIFCLMLPVIISETEKMEEAEREMEDLNKNYEFEEIHYKLLEEKQEQLAKIRHDFNNQLMTVTALQGMGRSDEARSMLIELEKQLEEKGSMN